MSQKDRERQKRRQKRGERHKQKRAGVPHRAASQPNAAEVRREAMGALIEDCRALFAREGRIGDDLRGEIREAGDFLGGVWARLVFEIEGFLYHEKPWDLRCDELSPLRRHFEDVDAGPVFDRIWTLCRSNDPELYAPTTPGPDPTTEGLDRAGRLAFALWRLHAGLEAPKEDRAPALKAIREQVGKLTGNPKTARALCDLLNTALSSLLSLLPAGRGRKPAVAREVQLARDAETFLRTQLRAHAEAGWWSSSRTLLREVLRRHVRARGSAWLRGHPELLEALYGAPIAALCHPPAEVERRLQAIHPDRQCEEWLGFLEERIDREALGFEHRLRYEIARTRLLQARAGHLPTEVSVGERRDLTDAFEGLFGLLGRGVPPEERHLPPVLEPIVLDYYAETCRTLEISKTDLRLCEALMRRHPEDHRLACLYATGALSSRGPIGVLETAGARSWSHVEPELFAECADHWRSAAGQDRARALLYTPLAREEQKQCVLALTRRRLRAVSTPETCRAAVEGLAAYLEAVYEALSHGAALERELVFVGALTAAWRGMPLPVLSYAAFIQLAGYGAALGRELPAAEGLVIEFLERHPECWFTRADGWQRLEALSEALPERGFRKLRPALKRLLGRLPPPTLGGAAHQRLLRRLGIPVERRRSPGGRTAAPENADGPRRSIPLKKTMKQGELFDDLGP